MSVIIKSGSSSDLAFVNTNKQVSVSVDNIANPLPAGTNVIGHVITDTGSTTAVTGTVAVTQSTSPWIIAGAAASGGAKSGNPVQIGGVFNTTQPTVTTGQAVEAQSTARGAQIVSPGVDNFAVQATLAAETTKVIGTVNQGTSPWVVSLTSTTITGTVASTQSGTWNMRLQDGSGTAINKGSATSANSLPVVIASDQAAIPTQQTPATSGGMGLPFSAAVTSTKVQVKGAAGQVYGWSIMNNGSVPCYIQVFNLASASVTVGTTVPDYVIPIPAPSSGTNGAGQVIEISLGIAHSTGITLACTTTRGGSTTATCDVLFFYK